MFRSTEPSYDHEKPTTASKVKSTATATRSWTAHNTGGTYSKQWRTINKEPNHTRTPSRFLGQALSCVCQPTMAETMPRRKGDVTTQSFLHALVDTRASSRWLTCCHCCGKLCCCAGAPPMVFRSCGPSCDSAFGGEGCAALSLTSKYPAWPPPSTRDAAAPASRRPSLSALTWSCSVAVRNSASLQIVGSEVTARSTRMCQAHTALSSSWRLTALLGPRAPATADTSSWGTWTPPFSAMSSAASSALSQRPCPSSTSNSANRASEESSRFFRLCHARRASFKSANVVLAGPPRCASGMLPYCMMKRISLSLSGRPPLSARARSDVSKSRS
mmetsp:Transcript_67734/g.207563  ORF Transcript_67734/g.207563 Transcript_67734/m.207563 type:complete len:331 (+) Transcript_67734:154-1146(+)